MGKDASDIDQEVGGLSQTRARVVQGIRNPIGMAIGAAAVGFLLGLILPATRVEKNTLPRVRDRLGEQMKAVDLMERAGRVLEETKRAAAQAVEQQAREASETLSACSSEET